MSTPILATKLYMPAPRSRVVPRPRLIERLDAGLDGKLTLDLGRGRLRQDHPGQRLGRRLRAAGRLAVAGRRRQRPHPLPGLSDRRAADGRPAAWARARWRALQAPQPPPAEAILTAAAQRHRRPAGPFRPGAGRLPRRRRAGGRPGPGLSARTPAAAAAPGHRHAARTRRCPWPACAPAAS